MKRLLILLAAMAIASLAVSACSTMEGVGKDIQKGGEAIEKKAKE